MANSERPTSVSDLRKLFEGKGKAQTPSEFHSKTRAAAARHNLTVRMQQVAEKKRKQSIPNPFEDSRLAGLTENDLEAILSRAIESYQEDSTAIQIVLDKDVSTGDTEIDNMSIRELRDFISAHGVKINDSPRLADLRLMALKAKKDAETTSSVDISLIAPELTDALSKGTESDINRAILQMFFEEYDPSRLNEIDTLLEKHKGEEDELFAELAWKYPDHAEKIVAISINAAYGAPATHPLVELKPLASNRRVSFVVTDMKISPL